MCYFSVAIIEPIEGSNFKEIIINNFFNKLICMMRSIDGGHDEMKGVSFFSKFHSLVLFVHGGMPTRKLGIEKDWMKGVFFFIYIFGTSMK